MKLLIISSWCPYPPTNGAKLRAYHLLRELAPRHKITLLTFAEPGEDRDLGPLAALCANLRTVPGNPFKPTKPLSNLDFFKRVPRSYVQTFSPEMQRLVDLELRNQDAAMALEIGAAMYLRGRRTVPRIVDEIEVGSLLEDYERQPRSIARARRGLTWWKYSQFVRDLTSKFDAATVVSEIERSHLARIGCDTSRISVVPNGVDRADLRRIRLPTPARLIYPGAVTFSANLDAVRFFVGDILPRIQQRRRDVSLQVTGDVGDVDVDDLERQSGVTFTGRVRDIKTNIAHANVCVVPLRIGGGTRLKILEAAALGTPVVATSKGAEGLKLEHERDILIADTPEDFAASTLRLLDDPWLCARLATNARKVVAEHYTWDKIGSQLDAIINRAATRLRAVSA